MDIHIGIGVGRVPFGMTEDEVAAAMDEPECYEAWMGGNLDRHLFFHGLLFGFEDYRRCDPGVDSGLTEIAVHGRGDARFLGRFVEGWTKHDVTVALRQVGREPTLIANGDLNVIGNRELLELSFGHQGMLTRVGLEGRRQG